MLGSHRRRWGRAAIAGSAALVLLSSGHPVAGAVPPMPTGILAEGDIDEDGIPDLVELQGIRRPDGSMSMDLPALGASPCRKTILVEIDYMAAADGSFDHRPDIFGGPPGAPDPELGVFDTRFEDHGHNQIAVGNLDGDPSGKQEIALADHSEGGRVHVYDATTGVPDPDLGVHDMTFDDDLHNQLAVGDVNGDGRDEILIANDSGGRVDVLDATTHQPVPHLGVHDTRFNNHDHNQIAVGNLDGDPAGKEEIALADHSEGGRVHVYDATTHQPVPHLGVHDTTFENNGHNQLAVGDLNGDGRDEILIANDSGGRIDVLDATTHGPVVGLGVPDTRFNNDDHNQLAVGDVDGDYRRHDEVLIADASEGGRIHVFGAAPAVGAIDEVSHAFATAPVGGVAACPYAGADGGSGIQLIVDVNGTIPHKELFEMPEDFATTKANPANFDPARDPYVHYNLWVDEYSADGKRVDSSGLANFYADSQDFLVSFGDFAGGNGTTRNQSGTFMHELGHSLGLDHGGDEDDINHKPSYLSVMNYNFQLNGLTNAITRQSGINYSDADLADLDALHLNEQVGLDPDVALRTRWFPPSGSRITAPADRPIDWNNDGDTDDTDVSVAIHSGICVEPGGDDTLETAAEPTDQLVGTNITSGDDRVCDTAAAGTDVQRTGVGKGRILTGYNDWANLDLRRGFEPNPSTVAELTTSEAEEIDKSHDQALSPDLATRLNTPVAGMWEAVLGTAMDERNIYATHYYHTIAQPSVSTQPGSLIVLDRQTMQVRARVRVGFSPHAVAVNPTTGRIYVLNAAPPGSPTINQLTVIDRRSLSVITTIPMVTGQTTTDVVVNPRTNRIYVSNSAIGRVHVIDGATNTELPPILTGRGPLGMAVDESTNTIYMAMNRRAEEPIITALGAVTDDGVTQTIHPQVPLGEPLTQPIDVAVDPLNNRIYTANLGGGGVQPSVTVLDLATRRIIKRINITGPARSITVNPLAHQVFVAVQGKVDVIGEQSLSLVRSIPTPAGASWSVITPTGQDRQLYVGDLRTGELTRLSYSSGTRK
jgi:YVTN family beta-propeller protein